MTVGGQDSPSLFSLHRHLPNALLRHFLVSWPLSLALKCWQLAAGSTFPADMSDIPGLCRIPEIMQVSA